MTTTDYRPVAQDSKPTLTQLINNMKPEIARALPKHMNPDRMARIATTVLRQTPALGRCTPESFLGALMTASQLGLEPGPLGEAYLVPYGTTATFIPGYRGLVKLAYQSGQVAKVGAHVVHEQDEFDYALGLDPFLTHKPSLAADPGKVVAVYAMVKFKDGASNFEVMSVAQVEAIRARSRSGNNGPWKTDWEAMARKTVFKRLSKWMPLSSEFALASTMDESVRTDATADLVDVRPDYIDADDAEQVSISQGTDEQSPQPGEVESLTSAPAGAKKPTKADLDALDAAFTAGGYAASDGSREDWLGNTIREVKSVRDLTKDEVLDATAVLTGAKK
jgi:recombination protein RecT